MRLIFGEYLKKMKIQMYMQQDPAPIGLRLARLEGPVYGPIPRPRPSGPGGRNPPSVKPKSLGPVTPSNTLFHLVFYKHGKKSYILCTRVFYLTFCGSADLSNSVFVTSIEKFADPPTSVLRKKCSLYFFSRYPMLDKFGKNRVKMLPN